MTVLTRYFYSFMSIYDLIWADLFTFLCELQLTHYAVDSFTACQYRDFIKCCTVMLVSLRSDNKRRSFNEQKKTNLHKFVWKKFS